MVLAGCDTKSTSAISDGTTIKNLRMISPFDKTVYSNYFFTIDTVNNEIYNEDSLAFGTRVDSLAPVLLPVFAKAVLDGGEINLYERDTVYVDFTKEHTLTVTASDTTKKRTYRIRVNVHQVDPDSLSWKYQGEVTNRDVRDEKCIATENGDMVWLINDGGLLRILYSFNGKYWSVCTTEGIEDNVENIDITHAIGCNDHVSMMAGTTLYSSSGDIGIIYGWNKHETTSPIEIEHLLFELNNTLYALGKGNKILSLNGNNWEIAAEMPSGFPVDGEASCVGKSPSGKPRAFVACGIDEMGKYLSDVWSTEDGKYWVKLSLKDSLVTPRAYAGLVQYASGLMLIGGVDNNDEMVEDNYIYSKDYGMTWQSIDSVFSTDLTGGHIYSRRANHSVVTTEDGHIVILGGITYSVKNGGIPPREKKYRTTDMWKGIHYASLPGFKK